MYASPPSLFGSFALSFEPTFSGDTLTKKPLTPNFLNALSFPRFPLKNEPMTPSSRFPSFSSSSLLSTLTTSMSPSLTSSATSAGIFTLTSSSLLRSLTSSGSTAGSTAGSAAGSSGHFSPSQQESTSNSSSNPSEQISSFSASVIDSSSSSHWTLMSTVDSFLPPNELEDLDTFTAVSGSWPNSTDPEKSAISGTFFPNSCSGSFSHSPLSQSKSTLNGSS